MSATTAISGQLTSFFIYVSDVEKSLEFYNEIMGAEISQVIADPDSSAYILGILRLGGFTIMLHPKDAYVDENQGAYVRIGINPQFQVADIDAFHQHCLNQGAFLRLAGEPVEQEWGWKELGISDPDGFLWTVYQDKSDPAFSASSAEKYTDADVKPDADQIDNELTSSVTAGQLTSIFIYVSDVEKSLEFYNEVMGAEIEQIVTDPETSDYTLAIVQLNGFMMMLQLQESNIEDINGVYVRVGIHPQLLVADIDAFYQHCLDQGALLRLSGEPIEQEWGWRELAVSDPDGYLWSVYQDKSGGQWT